MYYYEKIKYYYEKTILNKFIYIYIYIYIYFHQQIRYLNNIIIYFYTIANILLL